MTQYISYQPKSLQWDDSIVSGADEAFCGPLVHVVEDSIGNLIPPTQTSGWAFYTDPMTNSPKHLYAYTNDPLYAT